MKIQLHANGITVTREPGDKKYYGNGNAAGESNFLHALKTELNRRGFQLIKKRMWRDGHLVDDMQQYLRTRNSKCDSPHVYFYSSFFALRGLNDDWNDGEVFVAMDLDIYGDQPNCSELIKSILS